MVNTVSVKCMPSVLSHCWLGTRKSRRQVKIQKLVSRVLIRLERGASVTGVITNDAFHDDTFISNHDTITRLT